MENNLVLQQANSAIRKAIEDAKRMKNENDRNYIATTIGVIINPLLKQIAENSRLTRDDIKEAIKEIKKADSTQVSIIPPEVKVTIPEIKIPEIKIPPIKLPTINVPKPEVTVNVPEMKMPKYMEIKELIPLLKELKEILKKPVAKESDEPRKVMLIDPKTNKEYKAGGSMITGGGGGSRTPIATGSKITEVSLTSPASWYKYTIPDNTIMLDMFLTVQGYTSYYKWGLGADEGRIPIFGGYSRHLSGVQFNKKDIYFTCPTASQTIVVEAFVGI